MENLGFIVAQKTVKSSNMPQKQVMELFGEYAWKSVVACSRVTKKSIIRYTRKQNP